MTWKGQHPVVKLVTQTYKTGIRLTKQAMAEVENQIQRLTGQDHRGEQLNLGKWFVDVFYHPELKLE
jgi:hypothetical protein